MKQMKKYKLGRPVEPPAPPTLRDIELYFEQLGMSPHLAEHFFDYYEARGWVLRDGRPVMNWEALARIWKRNQDTWALTYE